MWVSYFSDTNSGYIDSCTKTVASAHNTTDWHTASGKPHGHCFLIPYFIWEWQCFNARRDLIRWQKGAFTRCLTGLAQVCSTCIECAKCVAWHHFSFTTYASPVVHDMIILLRVVALHNMFVWYCVSFCLVCWCIQYVYVHCVIFFVSCRCAMFVMSGYRMWYCDIPYYALVWYAPWNYITLWYVMPRRMYQSLRYINMCFI